MSTPPTVAVCLPSRGLIHSRTLEATLVALENALRCQPLQCAGWFLTHALPIPACHEKVAERALHAGAEYLWFVEEDMIPPPDALTALLSTQRQTGAGIVTIDYPIGEQPTQSAIMRKQSDHTIWWCGLGCTLITRTVFETLPRPWFLSEHPGVFIRNGERGPWRYEATAQPNVYAYGGQDVWLCYQATQAGFTIAQVPGMVAGHARLRSWGAQHTNDGAHRVDVLREIEVHHAG